MRIVKIPECENGCLRTRASFLKDKAGTIIVAFAIMLPVLIGSVGMSMDLAESYLVRQRLGGTIDAAALAATASESDPDKIEQRVQEFFHANYPDDRVGIPHDLITTVDEENDEVTVSAYADYNTTFMKVLGIDRLTVFRTTTVKREIQGLEVMMVLDNTGSMADGDKIGALKTAATDLVNILFDKADDPEHIKIGMVPYANAVRVGRYGIGINPDGTSYENADGTAADPFITLPAGISWTTDINSSTGWYGCVIEHNPDDPGDSDTTMVPNSRGQLWTSGAHPFAAHGWDPTKTTNDDYPQDVSDDFEGPWDIYSYGSINVSTTCAQYDCRYYHCSQGKCQQYQCQQQGCQQYHCQTNACQTYYTDPAHCSCKTFWSDNAHCATWNASHTTCLTYQCKTFWTTPAHCSCQTQYTDGDTNASHCAAYYKNLTPLSNCQTFYTDGDTNAAHCAVQYTDAGHCEAYYTDGDTTASHCASYYDSIPPNSNCKTFWTASSNPSGTHCLSWNPPSVNYTKSSTPNRYCPVANVQALTSDQSVLLADIAAMEANGNTRGDIGAMWGYRLISPDPPFTEGAQWTDKNWRKAVIMMTDGMNTKDGTYAGDWFTDYSQKDVTDYNQRFSEICAKLKNQGVIVYTIILGTNGQYTEPDQSTKDLYKACASDATKYFDSQSNQALIDAFNKMANQLANLHISK
jgi:Flp pilus assembly protein TadG